MAPTKSHFIILPLPLQGHIIPATNLAITLAASGHTVTFINTESTHQHLNPTTPNIFSSSGLDVRYEVVSDGLPLEFGRREAQEEFLDAFENALVGNVEEVVGRVVVEGQRTCLVADTFVYWAERVCRRFGIGFVSFWTEPALVFLLYWNMDLLRINGHFGGIDNRKDKIDYIPGIDTIDPSDLMSYLQEADTTTRMHKLIYKAFDSAKKADIILCNTIQELESQAISTLQSFKPFYAIGPLFPSDFSTSVVPTSLWPESDCTYWLDIKAPNSVLYISFGSLATIDKNDLEEIAMGVVESGVDFIWVVRPGQPNPFTNGMINKLNGLVMDWCCQRQVLSHPSIGGFVTHCGWNSVLESMWCGVPMLCFPNFTDQFTNRRLVVNWGVGMDAGVGREEVKKRLVEVMKGEMGVEMKRKMREVKEKFKSAMLLEGSLKKNLQEFIADIGGQAEKS